MRKLVIDLAVVARWRIRSSEQVLFDWDDVVDAHGAAIIATQDAVILGRHSYDEWSEFCPGSDIEPFASSSTTFRNTLHPRRRSSESGATRQ
jgi:hypothetical protein